MVNKLWSFFIISGIGVCLITGKVMLSNQEILSSGKQALDMTMQLFPVMALWLGIMKIASESGLLHKLSLILNPILLIFLKSLKFLF